ncbi:hypothetical protein BGW42_006449 [Actinomortierella wolfii]|nr:hypothetical protein BGW41_001361 [Actinomortierella wolfii]KAG0234564.1 hypothetical protein BGW42_006449 [Actinomortierella wolfii]
MGASYVIFGRQVPTYKLALATYALVASPVVASKVSKKETSPANVAIKASSKEEEDFIREFVRAAEEK